MGLKAARLRNVTCMMGMTTFMEGGSMHQLLFYRRAHAGADTEDGPPLLAKLGAAAGLHDRRVEPPRDQQPGVMHK